MSAAFRDNSKPPAIRFIRKNGRVIPIVQRQRVTKAAPLVEQRLEEMTSEVQWAERGARGVGYDENRNAVSNFSTVSTFPSFYSKLGFKGKDDFYRTVVKRESKKFDLLADQAISDLKDGYQIPTGQRVPANRDFRVLTKQTWDNRGVSFRKIDGIVRPMRFKVKDDEAPF